MMEDLPVELLVIAAGLLLAWFMRRRSVDRLTPILKILAAERDGVVESRNIVMPRLVFQYNGHEVELSSSSAGDGSEMTYVQFSGLDLGEFHFRVAPKALPGTGLRSSRGGEPVSFLKDQLGRRIHIFTNNEAMVNQILNEEVERDLLIWADWHGRNRIEDIRNYDERMIYAVSGELKNHGEYRSLIDSACRMLDQVVRVAGQVSEPPQTER